MLTIPTRISIWMKVIVLRGGDGWMRTRECPPGLSLVTLPCPLISYLLLCVPRPFRRRAGTGRTGRTGSRGSHSSLVSSSLSLALTLAACDHEDQKFENQNFLRESKISHKRSPWPPHHRSLHGPFFSSAQ